MLWSIFGIIFFVIVVALFANAGLLTGLASYINITNDNFFSAMPPWLYIAIGLLIFALLFGTAASYRKK